MPGRPAVCPRTVSIGIVGALIGIVTDGQAVRVTGTGFPLRSMLGVAECPATAQSQFDCQVLGLVETGTTGAIDQSVHVSRLADLGSRGIVDCVSVSCVVAVGAGDRESAVFQPVTFAPTTLPPPDFAIALGSAYLDGTGRITATADVTCNATKSLGLAFDLQTGTKTGDGFVAFPCVAGTTVHAISDFIGSGSTPGPMTLQVVARGGTYPVQAKGSVDLLSTADARAAFVAALQGPGGARALAQLFYALRFRLRYDRVFAHEFYVALLQAMHA